MRRPKKRRPYFSQFREDRWIVKNLSLPEFGIFVEVGASDGVANSNTYYFEKRGWKGLCIDADSRNSEELRANRKLVEICAVSSTPGQREFYQHVSNPTQSGLTCRGKEWEPIIVPVHTLQELLEKHDIGSIDLLSIDTEGSEVDVWNSFDSEQFRPKIVIAEFDEGRMGGTEKDLTDAITHGPYKALHKTRANLIFQRYEE